MNVAMLKYIATKIGMSQNVYNDTITEDALNKVFDRILNECKFIC